MTPRQMADTVLMFQSTLQSFLATTNHLVGTRSPEDQEKCRHVHEILGHIEMALVAQAHDLQRMKSGVFD